MTLRDIVKELEKPGRDPREEMPKPILRSDVLDMKDLKEGMILKGTVRTVIDFGAFVDIGVHQDGLVHISEMSDSRFVKHPLDAVSVGDVVNVRILSVDQQKKRISLSMKLDGTDKSQKKERKEEKRQPVKKEKKEQRRRQKEKKELDFSKLAKNWNIRQ